ncbi:MAG: hypothetical protein OXU72_17770 [Gammaproteobacteria bacterium]|nr:hypothetical protein [Gammaproteobacteria bacterium]
MARTVAGIIGRLNVSSEHATIRRENELVLNALRNRVAERYGPSIADRSVRAVHPPTTEPFVRIDRCAIAVGWRHARTVCEEIRNRPEVKAYLHGGDGFGELSGRFNPASEQAVHRYERSLIDSISGPYAGVGADRIAAIAESVAQDCFESGVRRAEELDIEYGQLAAHLEGDPRQHKRFGCFSARGVSPTTPFFSFAKTDRDGELLTRSTTTPVTSLQDKVHLSVHEQDVSKAWEVLRPLLLSEDNPFLRWKLSSLEHRERSLSKRLEGIAERERAGEAGPTTEKLRRQGITRTRRLNEGGQFTLYAYALVDDPSYGTYGARFRHFLESLDRELAGHGVRRGIRPGSDVLIEGLAFASYRNARIGTRGAGVGEAPVTEAMIEALKATPFYHSIAPSRS